MQTPKIISKFSKAVLVILLALGTSTAFAAHPRHYLIVWGEGGYTNFLHKFTDVKALGSGGVGFGGGYQFRKDAFLMVTGLEITSLNTFNKVNALSFDDITFKDSDPFGQQITYHVDYEKYKERQHAGYVQIPLLFGAQFRTSSIPIYFLVGAKAGVNLFSTYGVHVRVRTTATYERYIDDFVDMPNHYYTTTNMHNGDVTHNDKIKLGLPQVVASAEIGVVLDKFIYKKKGKKRSKGASGTRTTAIRSTANANAPSRPASPAGRRIEKFKKEPMHLRVALFADYGLLNMYNSGYNSDARAKTDPVTMTIPSATSGITFASNSVNNSQRVPTGSEKLNNLFVGVKGSLTFDVTKPPKKKPVPRKPKKPVPPKPIPPKPVLAGRVIDQDTKEPIYDPQVDIFDMSGKRVYGSQPTDGSFNTKLDRTKQYRISITAPGYIKADTTVANVTSLVEVHMQPIKIGEKFIIENIFFEFDKTDILPESEPALIRLAHYLLDNPNLVIHITGHTDSQGSEQYNQKLSEGRAKSVMDDMIKRGIAAERMTFSGKGESEPIATNETAEGREQNRRVEFEIVDYLDNETVGE